MHRQCDAGNGAAARADDEHPRLDAVLHTQEPEGESDDAEQGEADERPDASAGPTESEALARRLRDQRAFERVLESVKLGSYRARSRR